MRLHKRADRSGPEPAVNDSWPLDHVEVLEAADQENLPTAFVDRAVFEGWATLDRGKLILHSKPKLTYKIVRAPGRYCAHCLAPLDSESAAREHLEAEHLGEESPDPANPAGWRVDNFYACEKAS